MLAFTGVRGIVSLAAALAIPLTTVAGQPFPYRDLILLLTFSLILITLVGQGLMLPWVIRMLNLSHAGRKEREFDRAEERQARAEAVKAAIAALDEIAPERNFSPDALEIVRLLQEDRLKRIEGRRDSDEAARIFGEHHDELDRLLITAERARIIDLYRSDELKDEARRRIEREARHARSASFQCPGLITKAAHVRQGNGHRLGAS